MIGLGYEGMTVYVAEKRYTKEFMDKADFTVMTFDVKDSKVLNYMGTKSRLWGFIRHILPMERHIILRQQW